MNNIESLSKRNSARLTFAALALVAVNACAPDQSSTETVPAGGDGNPQVTAPQEGQEANSNIYEHHYYADGTKEIFVGFAGPDGKVANSPFQIREICEGLDLLTYSPQGGIDRAVGHAACEDGVIKQEDNE